MVSERARRLCKFFGDTPPPPPAVSRIWLLREHLSYRLMPLCLLDGDSTPLRLRLSRERSARACGPPSVRFFPIERKRERRAACRAERACFHLPSVLRSRASSLAPCARGVCSGGRWWRRRTSPSALLISRQVSARHGKVPTDRFPIMPTTREGSGHPCWTVTKRGAEIKRETGVGGVGVRTVASAPPTSSSGGVNEKGVWDAAVTPM